VQAGLYPNPTFHFSADELGDRTGPGGILTAMASQEIVRGGKLNLSRAAAEKEVDQATLNTISERYRVFTEIRQAFFELSLLQSRANILEELVTLAKGSTANAEKLLKAKETARLDVVQLEVDLERYRAELEATQRAMPAVFRRLAASVGVPELAPSVLECDFDTPPPELDLDRVRAYVLEVHPEVRSAQVGVERAKLLLARAEVEPIPNVTVGAGYVYQGQNRSNDAVVSVSMPIPLHNQNQGNIQAARAELAEALNRVGRTQNDLSARLALSFANYTAARKRAERYATTILPRAEETYQLSLKAYQGGQFEYLRVLAAQRTVAEAKLERVRALGEMWQAGSEIAGLMLEDQWPPLPASERKQP
jgi:cobalt-zinc-cadmium efflux system outer membrane protein